MRGQTPTYHANLEFRILVLLQTFCRILIFYYPFFHWMLQTRGLLSVLLSCCFIFCICLFIFFVREESDIFNWIFCLVLWSIVSSYFPFWYTVYFVVRSVCFVACHCVYFLEQCRIYTERKKNDGKNTNPLSLLCFLGHTCKPFHSALSKVISTT